VIVDEVVEVPKGSDGAADRSAPAFRTLIASPRHLYELHREPVGRLRLGLGNPSAALDHIRGGDPPQQTWPFSQPILLREP
jgi:hypothetical protein